MNDLYSKQEYTFCLPWKLKSMWTQDVQPFSVLFPTVISETYTKLFKSDQPSRHIAVISKSSFDLISKQDLIKEIQLNIKGKIRAIYPNISSGTVMIISYYSLSDAKVCLDFIKRKFKFEYKSFYAKPCSINKNINEKLFVIITNQSNTLEQFDYMVHLSRIGDIYSISQTTISPSCIILNLEYDDERSNEKLLTEYSCSLIDGVQVNVHMASNDHHLCNCDNVDMSPATETDVNWSTVNDDDNPYFVSDLFAFKNTSSPLLTSSSSSSTSLKQIKPESPTPPPPCLSWKDAIVNGMKKPVTTTPAPTITSEVSGNVVDIEKIKRGLDKRTTFMIRNIPNKYTQKMLIEFINKTHAKTYDFLYLRMDFKNKCNVGYAFINFIEPKFVVSFAKETVGKSWKHFNSDKKCALSYANIQGKEALIKKFRNSTVMYEQRNFRPKLFYSSGPNTGKEQEFPKPDAH